MTSNPTRLLITPSLLNSWLWLWQSEDESAKGDFLNSLNRVKTPPNKYMLEGIKYEEECYRGKTEVSPIIEGGAFQIVGMKKQTIAGRPYLLYGRLDVLKAGTIYDIKRVWKYTLPKYNWSSQHGFYMDLFPSAERFEYLCWDGYRLHREAYLRGDYVPTEARVAQFARWLEDNGLFETYASKWKAKGE